MRDWMDFNGDGEVDFSERMFADEMLCGSQEEHMSLFGNAGNFEEDEEADLEYDAVIAGVDLDKLEFMDEEKRREVLEDAGLDPDDYDFD